ncbi:MFS transporter [Amycolatopsis cihanbeyliensis]|uniref:NNP family nitrate/nitrite transporter-like MFS transporter n=1 Tax=Amycolatopsis cihanbeyliensis TaxID=1128664 RepID=A0A542DKF9_AMYCI|nr:MFS transporter [Amycolatopsis cihanbeyliensis]TQJ03572.1 NNP family nitrate/nitrite transporter-like MFS transporter [Amycolatopsis cihanbeyliensis]
MIPRPAVRGSRQRALWLATLGFFGGFAGVAVFGPLVPEFVNLLRLSPIEAGLLAGTPSLTGSLLRIPFGAMVDRIGGRAPFLVLLGLTLAGMIGLILLLWSRYPGEMAGTYPLLLGLGVLIGCGIASFPVGTAQISYWFPRNGQGGPLGIYAGIGNTGPSLSALFLPMIVASLSMLAAYGLWTVVLLLITIGYAVAMRDAPWFQLRKAALPADSEQLAAFGQELVPPGSLTGGLRAAAREPATWVLVGCYLISFGGFLALTAWLPTYWNGAYHTSLGQGGLLTFAFALVAALVRVPGGLLSDRISIRYALLGNFLLIGGASLAVALTGRFWIAFLATIGIAIGMGLQNAVVFKLLPCYVPHAIGGAAGWVSGLGAVGGFVLPPVMGAIAAGGPGGYSSAFLAITVLVAGGLTGVGWLTRWTWACELEPRRATTP